MREKRLHYTVFAVEGLNRERLFNALQKKGVTLYDVKIFGPKRAEFAVDSRELKNFFAITDNLCYNIKKVGERGIAAPFAALFRRFGVLVGALLFAAFVAASDFAVLSVDYYGSGAVYKDYAGEVLSACGVKPFAFTDDERLERAAAALLKNSDVFSFASVEKHGTRVKVNLVLSPEASGVVDTERKELVCPVDGVVESITVLRGTALVAAGDVVKKGDVLTVAQVAGVMGAKRTPELIPMCHPVLIDGIDLALSLDEARCSVEIRATVSCAGRTGVEMEALSAVSAAALTVYDMCKAVDRGMEICDIHLLRKEGGRTGLWTRE